ncbi:MAG: hypothetical protein SEPTF4163_001336 [Sporothrix epigloea]
MPAATPATSSANPASPTSVSTSEVAAAIASLGPPPPVSVATASPISMALVTPTSSSAATRLLELRLLHHYITETSKTLSCQNPSAEKIWRDNVPRVAFEAASGAVHAASNHLMDAMLAVAALHLRSEFPQDRELIQASHAYMASSLSEYNRLLQQGITAANAEALFLNSTLIAFQSTATRIFSKDEQSTTTSSLPSLAENVPGREPYTLSHMPIGVGSGTYGLPMSWFHAFQGVKAITAASWPWLRRSNVVLPIINAQPALHLDIASAKDGFFGHLLDDVDEELSTVASSMMSATGVTGTTGATGASITSSDRTVNNTAEDTPTNYEYDHLEHNPSRDLTGDSQREAKALHNSSHVIEDPDESARSRHAYQHAVAVLNWAHNIRHSGACLAFPATVSRRFVELLGQRTPRALAILACFFAMLKTLDSVWWLHGMARREVLGVVSMFNSDAVPVDVERRWWPHMQWAVRVALYHDDKHSSDYVPAEVWGSSWLDSSPVGSTGDSAAAAAASTVANTDSYVKHIDMITETINKGGNPAEFREFNFASP